MAAVLLAVEERIQKLFSAIALIALVNNAILAGWKVPSGSQIHSLPAAATIFQARKLSSKMVFTKKIASTCLLSKV